MRFLHIADVHLGNQQYNVKERFNDFGKAFLDAVDLAIEQNVQAVVVAGDLFHKASVEPLTLLQAQDGLQRLRETGIPVLAVHGNHDKARYLAQISWLEYLAEQGLMRLLAPDTTRTPCALPAWDDAGNSGAYCDIQHVRFVGVPWLGAAAPRMLEEVAEALKALERGATTHTVLITHAGVEGQMPNMPGGLTFNQLAPLRELVDYIALGHLHKPYSVEDWIFNPGSLETCSFDEAQYARGCYLVEVAPDGAHAAQHVVTTQRPFISLVFDTDLAGSPDELFEGVRAYLLQERRGIERRLSQVQDEARRLPVVRLVLRGNLTFDRSRVDLDALRAMMREELEALLVRVENRTSPLGMQVKVDDSMDRAAIERAVFDSLAAANTEYSADAGIWSTLMRQVKGMALEGETPAAIFALLDETMEGLEVKNDVDHKTTAE
ncbi:MAG: exonuclease SbcCD subunit D [Anaerolineae bacterium]|nr:exonuclease SbcCD subunit D [Anaerolineae bacterium]